MSSWPLCVCVCVFCSWPIFSYCIWLFSSLSLCAYLSLKVYEFVYVYSKYICLCRSITVCVYLDHPLAHTWSTTTTTTAAAAAISFTLLYKIKIDYFFSYSLALSTCCNVFYLLAAFVLRIYYRICFVFLSIFFFAVVLALSYTHSFIGSQQLASLACTSSSSSLSFSFTFLLFVYVRTYIHIYMWTVWLILLL